MANNNKFHKFLMVFLAIILYIFIDGFLNIFSCIIFFDRNSEERAKKKQAKKNLK